MRSRIFTEIVVRLGTFLFTTIILSFHPKFNFQTFQSKVRQDLRLNDQRQKEDPDTRARKFFSQLPRSIIIQLYHAYKIDFDMFGYQEPKKYIEMGYILPDESNEIGPPNNDPRRRT